MSAGAFSRSAHRVHRAVGNVLSVLLLAWFASGAVMTFSGYPRFTATERLATAPLLPLYAEVQVPPTLALFLGEQAAREGARARLAMHEGVPTWLWTDARGERTALRARAPHAVVRLDRDRARAEAERRLHGKVTDVVLMSESDQWTVALVKPGNLPLHRVRFAGEDGREAYLSARTGEVVQDSLRSERALAWVGAIPHWIYPTILRRERWWWRQTVLVLSALGLLLTLSGTAAGIHVWRATRTRRAIRDPYLRWHQALGLWFGAFASTWLFSGALSLTPLQWTSDGRDEAREQAALYGDVAALDQLPVQAALARCQQELRVRELELAVLASNVYAVCSDEALRTRVVDLTDPALTVRSLIAPERLGALAARLAGEGRYELTVAGAYDAYHYPTHGSPEAALPYARIALADEAGTTYYVDPARASLIQRHTRRTRLERWLYNGLHSFDIPGLYEHRLLWRTLMIAAMVLGTLLSGLGLGMSLRRRWRRWVKRRTHAS